MSRDFQGGDQVLIGGTGPAREHTGRILAPDHTIDIRAYLIDCDTAAEVHWVPEHDLKPVDHDSEQETQR